MLQIRKLLFAFRILFLFLHQQLARISTLMAFNVIVLFLEHKTEIWLFNIGFPVSVLSGNNRKRITEKFILTFHIFSFYISNPLKSMPLHILLKYPLNILNSLLLSWILHNSIKNIFLHHFVHLVNIPTHNIRTHLDQQQINTHTITMWNRFLSIFLDPADTCWTFLTKTHPWNLHYLLEKVWGNDSCIFAEGIRHVRCCNYSVLWRHLVNYVSLVFILLLTQRFGDDCFVSIALELRSILLKGPQLLEITLDHLFQKKDNIPKHIFPSYISKTTPTRPYPLPLLYFPDINRRWFELILKIIWFLN